MDITIRVHIRNTNVFYLIWSHNEIKFIYLWDGLLFLWNVKILKSFFILRSFKVVMKRITEFRAVPCNMKWGQWGEHFVTTTWDGWSCRSAWFTWMSVACPKEGCDAQSGGAYVICRVFISLRVFLGRCYWSSSRVFSSHGGCHSKASWDYVPLCRVNFSMDSM